MSLQLNLKFPEFIKAISSVNAFIELFDCDLDNYNSIIYGISQEVLKIFVKDNFLGRIREYYDKYFIFYQKRFVTITYNLNFSRIILKYNNMILKYYFLNLNIYRQKGLSFMDTRLLVIAVPLLVAASWALYNIGRLAIQQVQRLSR